MGRQAFPDPSGRRSSPPGAAIPAYDLYGEPQARVSLDPVHLEPLFTRSHAHNWTIRPHRHRSLYQVFWIQQGSGAIAAEGRELPFEAPALLIIPAGEVHGFRYEPQSCGYVLTLTDAFLAACRELSGGEDYPRTVEVIRVGERETLRKALNGAFSHLERAFRLSSSGRSTALAGYVFVILSLVQQGAEAEATARRPRSPQAELVARFREHIEDHFAEQKPLEQHCAQLGVTPSTLTRACRTVAGRSPLELLHERLMLEARRLLSYSSLNISQIAYGLGFEPAYFSRFFSRREGVSPAAFRRMANEGGRGREHLQGL